MPYEPPDRDEREDIPDRIFEGLQFETREDIPYQVYKKEDDRPDYRWYGNDGHGDFRLCAGSRTPVDHDDYNYAVCGATLAHTFERYGERRYCEKPAIKQFTGNTTYCNNHKPQENLKKGAMKRLKTGALAKSYESMFQLMEPHKQIVAIDLQDSLLDESHYDFEREYHPHVIDATDADIPLDEIEVKFPVPTEHRVRGQALWYAALDFIKMQNIRAEQFRVADAEDLTVGEKEFEMETEGGHLITVSDEHHLNLPLSRIQKDYKEHLDFGGVRRDETDEGEEMTAQEWVTVVEPDDADHLSDSMVHENEKTPMADIEIPENDSGE